MKTNKTFSEMSVFLVFVWYDLNTEGACQQRPTAAFRSTALRSTRSLKIQPSSFGTFRVIRVQHAVKCVLTRSSAVQNTDNIIIIIITLTNYNEFKVKVDVYFSFISSTSSAHCRFIDTCPGRLNRCGS